MRSTALRQAPCVLCRGDGPRRDGRSRRHPPRRAGFLAEQRRRARLPAGLRPLLHDRLRRAAERARPRTQATASRRSSSARATGAGGLGRSARRGGWRQGDLRGRRVASSFASSKSSSRSCSRTSGGSTTASGEDRAFDDEVLRAVDRARARARLGFSWPTEIVDPGELLHEMRLFKDDADLVAMRRAAGITREAHLRAMARARPGMHEYEVEALLLETFRKHGSERPAYGSIVGSGANATILHYREQPGDARRRAAPHRRRVRVRLLRERRHAHVPGRAGSFHASSRRSTSWSSRRRSKGSPRRARAPPSTRSTSAASR